MLIQRLVSVPTFLHPLGLFYPARLVYENVLRIFGEDKMAIGCHKRLAISFVKLVAALYCATRLG